MKRFFGKTIVRLVIGVVFGLLVGPFLSGWSLQLALSTKYLLGQVIFFLVPLIIIGFVAPSIVGLKDGTSRILFFSLAIAWISIIGASVFAALLGYSIVPLFEANSGPVAANPLPEILFRLDIPPLMGVMAALTLSLFLGLGAVWTRVKHLPQILEDFHLIVEQLVVRVLIPILPFFIAANFALLSYEGAVTRSLPIFVLVILVVILAHYVWLAVLHVVAWLYSGKNPWHILKYYGPTYVTALGTMSSAATLGVALQAIAKTDLLHDEPREFSIPFFATIHLCGSVITIVFFTMTVSQILYGTIPDPVILITFILLLSVFAIAAPGVPGGTVMAALGIIISVLGFDEAGIALLLTIFALQDGFGTAANITSDGPMALIVSTYYERSQKKATGGAEVTS